MNVLDRWVVVALGSNQGDSPALVRSAMDRLEQSAGQTILRSSLWRTTPVDCPPGSPAFVNAVAAWIPGLARDPEALLDSLQTMEREFGRRPKTVPNEPRPLDLDLIVCGAELRHTSRLTLPHPRAIQRAFVLVPLTEILPDLVLPGQTQTVRQLGDKLSAPQRASVERFPH